MSRAALSVPMQALARHAFLDGEKSVFDYGCGRGDDLSVLATAGIAARGWDPYYASDAPLVGSDVVNLGYVLNVIEDPNERMDTLRIAFGLARQAIAIAVMIVGKSVMSTDGLKAYRDGFLTARGTFQKYFTTEEARALIEKATGQEAIPVAPGIFFVFRDKIVEQRFLEGRHRRNRDISHLLAIAPPAAKAPTSKSQALLEENRDIIEATWKRAIELGRLPHLDELHGSVRRELLEQLGSIRKAVQLAQHIYNADALSQARQGRVDDLTMYFALRLWTHKRATRCGWQRA